MPLPVLGGPGRGFLGRGGCLLLLLNHHTLGRGRERSSEHPRGPQPGWKPHSEAGTKRRGEQAPEAALEADRSAAVCPWAAHFTSLSLHLLVKWGERGPLCSGWMRPGRAGTETAFQGGSHCRSPNSPAKALSRDRQGSRAVSTLGPRGGPNLFQTLQPSPRLQGSPGCPPGEIGEGLRACQLDCPRSRWLGQRGEGLPASLLL